jgi:hypothetical protein
MALNIDRIVGKTVKEVIYINDEESCARQDEFNDECKDIKIVFIDNSFTIIKGLDEDWLQIWTSLGK